MFFKVLIIVVLIVSPFLIALYSEIFGYAFFRGIYRWFEQNIKEEENEKKK